MSDTARPSLRQRLRARFAAPEYALFHEVPDATGSCTRRLDAVAMNLYASRGLTLNGFELKVSRSDFLREMKDPDKAEAVSVYMDHFYLVVEEGVCKPEEVPAFWGLLVPSGKSLRIAKQAAKLKPRPVTRQFLASLLRKGSEIPPAVQEELRSEAKLASTSALKMQLERMRQQKEGAESRLTELMNQVVEFRRKTGLSPYHSHEWDDLARLVLMAQHGGLEARLKRHAESVFGYADNQQRVLESLRESAERVMRELEELPQPDAEPPDTSA